MRIYVQTDGWYGAPMLHIDVTNPQTPNTPLTRIIRIDGGEVVSDETKPITLNEAQSNAEIFGWELKSTITL